MTGRLASKKVPRIRRIGDTDGKGLLRRTRKDLTDCRVVGLLATTEVGNRKDGDPSQRT